MAKNALHLFYNRDLNSHRGYWPSRHVVVREFRLQQDFREMDMIWLDLYLSEYPHGSTLLKEVQ